MSCVLCVFLVTPLSKYVLEWEGVKRSRNRIGAKEQLWRAQSPAWFRGLRLLALCTCPCDTRCDTGHTPPLPPRPGETGAQGTAGAAGGWLQATSEQKLGEALLLEIFEARLFLTELLLIYTQVFQSHSQIWVSMLLAMQKLSGGKITTCSGELYVTRMFRLSLNSSLNKIRQYDFFFICFLFSAAISVMSVWCQA